MLALVYLGLYGFVFLFGICLGSFLNVVVYRVPRGISLVAGRSFCPCCGKQIKNYDLIPLLSFLLLRGKCRNCHEIIARRYPLVELFSGLIAVFLFFHYGFSGQAILVSLVALVLLAVSLIDFDTMTIPDGLLLCLVPLAIAAIWLFPEISLFARIIGALCVALPLYLLTLVIPDCFGGGDIKLMLVAGFLLGWQNTLLATFIALLLGGGVALYLLLSHKKQRGNHIPFGPALCLGIFLAQLYGAPLIRAYLSFFNLS